MKTNSKKVQKEHLRHYRKSRKVTLVNRGVHRKAARPLRRLKDGTLNAIKIEQPPKSPVLLKPRKSALDDKEWSRLTVAALQMPPIAYKGANQYYPSSISELIISARLNQLIEEPADEPFKDYATNEEVLGYLSSASKIYPIDSDSAVIMKYLSTKVLGSQLPSRLKVDKLTDEQAKILKDLKQDIRKVQWEYMKTGGKDGSVAQA